MELHWETSLAALFISLSKIILLSASVEQTILVSMENVKVLHYIQLVIININWFNSDLNECLSPDTCSVSDTCKNTIGGYECESMLNKLFVIKTFNLTLIFIEGCVNGCGSHGICVQGQCACNGNFTGPKCESGKLILIFLLFN